MLVHKGGSGWFQARTEWWDSLPNFSLRKPAEQQVAILPHLRLFRNVVLFGPWLAYLFDRVRFGGSLRSLKVSDQPSIPPSSLGFREPQVRELYQTADSPLETELALSPKPKAL